MTSPHLFRVCNYSNAPKSGVRRADVLAYRVVSRGDVWVMLGIDADSGDISTFSGSIRVPETPVRGALREFDEESEQCFGDISTSAIHDSIIVQYGAELLLLIKLEWNNKAIVDVFNANHTRKSEMKSLYITTFRDLISAVKEPKSRVYEPTAAILLAIESNASHVASLEFLRV